MARRRASGLVALALITLSVGVGLAMAGKAFRKPGLPRKLMALHEHAALGGLIAIAVHGITLLGDRWLHPGPAGIAVPFVMDYRARLHRARDRRRLPRRRARPQLLRPQRIGAKLWRKLHRATIAVYVLAVVHTLGAGSDVPTPWVRPAMLITGAPILYLLTLRMLPQRPRGERRTRTGTSAVPGAS